MDTLKKIEKIKNKKLRDHVARGLKYSPGDMVRGYWDILIQLIIDTQKIDS